MTSLFNHLWQSTWFFLAAWILTLAMRNNSAAVRFRIWFAASCKFLIPFSMLIAVGNQFEWRPPAVAAPSPITMVVNHVAQPFPPPDIQVRRTQSREEQLKLHEIDPEIVRKEMTAAGFEVVKCEDPFVKWKPGVGNTRASATDMWLMVAVRPK